MLYRKKAMTHSLPSVRAQLALDWMCGIIDSKIYCLIVYCFFVLADIAKLRRVEL